MARRMCLEIPNLVDSYAVTLLQEALTYIYGLQYWSWQVQTGGWLTPGLLFPTGGTGPGQSAGTINATPFSNKVVGDSIASAAWATYVAGPTNLPLFTQLQIRSPFYSIYNIVSYQLNTPSAGLVTLTLDRPWMDPGGVQPYMIYQCYFPVPVPTNDFKRFLAARDITNDSPMDYWSVSQQDLATLDPQRTDFAEPRCIVPWQQDQRPLSATYGNMLYELWPHQLAIVPYTFGYLRLGPQMIKPSDTVPYPLTEECVLYRAKELAYQFKEAQKGEEVERGSGANWQFLSEAAHDEFKIAMKPVKDRDADLMPLYWATINRDLGYVGPYATPTGMLNVGRW